MAVARCLLLVGALVVSAAATVDEASVTPIAKVLQLMRDMVTKATASKSEERNKFSAFYQWCGDQTRVKNGEIKAGDDTIGLLNAKIEKKTVEIRQLTDRIEELDEDVGRWNKDKTSASDVRSKEKADFVATVQDYTESIDALSQAIRVLKKQAYDRPQAELVQSLIQVRSLRLLSSSSRRVLTAFLNGRSADPAEFESKLPNVNANSNPDTELFYNAPEAYSYEFQSGGIVEMLEKLHAEFGGKKTELEQEELNAQHSFGQIMQQLTDNIENAEHEISKKTALRATTQKEKAEAEGDLAQTTKERDEDQQYLDDMTALCSLKKSDFESRQKLRADELAALEQAIEIISSDAVAGSGDKHLPALMQVRAKRGATLAQLRSTHGSPQQSRLAAFLAERARLHNSRLLADVAQRAASDPFNKVKKLIKELISKLMQEATSETEHKGWCDTELTTNQQTRATKTEEIADLNSNIEDLSAEIAQLTQDIADLSEAVKELDEAMSTQTADRAASTNLNKQTIKEAKEAQTAVQAAIALLRDFYAKSAQATAFSQQAPATDAPETFEKPYRGLLPEGGSVIGFLEVILTDFSRLESQTAAAEEEEQAEYEKFMFESKKDKALKENEKQHKSDRRTDAEGSLKSAELQLKGTQEQLDEAVTYYEKLKPTCVDSGVTYQERVERREAEMQSLQEALKILSGLDMA